MDIPTSVQPATASGVSLGQGAPQSQDANRSMNPVSSWILTGISGLTLISVLGAIFAAGIWKGSIDTQLTTVADRQKQILDEQKEARQNVEALQNALSELKGRLQSPPALVPASHREKMDKP